MTDKRTFVLVHAEARQRAVQAVREAPDGYAVTVGETTRTLDQNSKLWPMLTDVARDVVWDGEKLSKEEWKDFFTAALNKQRMVRGMEGGIVFVGSSTSKMGKAKFSDLIELIMAFGAERGVRWTG